jgi:alkylated DNA nucleotide flippase Atl1
MTWEDLVEELRRALPRGSVTTYAEISDWAYGSRNKNQPVRSLLRGAANHGNVELTNRVVRENGDFADLPEGKEQQRNQLRNESVPLTRGGKVDFSRIRPVSLKRKHAI